MEHLKIPAERLKIILNKKSNLIKKIEDYTKTKITIDNELCEIVIEETKENKDPLLIWKARDVLRAIGRGFEPKTAMELLEDGQELKVVNLKEHIGKSSNALKRIKGRVIGSEGRIKKAIGDLTNTEMVVYGKTVSIIGRFENVYIAARAIAMLANGSMHGTVFGYIKGEMEKL